MHISATDLRGQLARGPRGVPVHRRDGGRARPAGLPPVRGRLTRDQPAQHRRRLLQRPGEPSPRFHGFGIWQRDSGGLRGGRRLPRRRRGAGRRRRRPAGVALRSLRAVGRAVAAYNAGAGAVAKALRKGKSCDSVTTGRDYSADVLARRSFLERDRNGAGSARAGAGSTGRSTWSRPGDTLSAIAARFHTTVAALAGRQRPRRPGRHRRGPGARPPGPRAGHSQAAHAARTHVVSAGETLSAVARDFHTSVDRLVALNHLADPDRIFVGQVLLVA